MTNALSKIHSVITTNPTIRSSKVAGNYKQVAARHHYYNSLSTVEQSSIKNNGPLIHKLNPEISMPLVNLHTYITTNKNIWSAIHKAKVTKTNCAIHKNGAFVLVPKISYASLKSSAKYKNAVKEPVIKIMNLSGDVDHKQHSDDNKNEKMLEALNDIDQSNNNSY